MYKYVNLVADNLVFVDAVEHIDPATIEIPTSLSYLDARNNSLGA